MIPIWLTCQIARTPIDGHCCSAMAATERCKCTEWLVVPTTTKPVNCHSERKFIDHNCLHCSSPGVSGATQWPSTRAPTPAHSVHGISEHDHYASSAVANERSVVMSRCALMDGNATCITLNYGHQAAPSVQYEQCKFYLHCQSPRNKVTERKHGHELFSSVS